MEQAQLNWIANFIWGIADDVLRDLYVRGKYRDVILPMTVLRRLDAVLEPTKKAVLDMKAALDKAKIVHQDQALRQAAASTVGALNYGNESTIAHLTGDKLRAHRFAFPPVGEQCSVVAWRDSARAAIHSSAAAADGQIRLANELRTRVVTDVVTGKLHVHEAPVSVAAEDLAEADTWGDAEDGGEWADETAASEPTSADEA